MIIHVVQPGDSVYSISQQYNVPQGKIISENGLINPGNLVVGQTLVINRGQITHTVEQGQSLYTIARMYGLPVGDILLANPRITNPAMLAVGQQITIPAPQKLGTIEVNGYAFPNINSSVLKTTLPYLTYLSIFSYQVKPDGSFDDINDVPLIEQARAAKVAPMMVITNLEPNAGFSSELAHTILSSEELQNKVIDNALSVMREKNYYGLAVDFEYIFPEDREKYNRFLRLASDRLRPKYILTTALAPKTSSTQQGLLYEAHDYPFHGRTVDHVVLMTYEWGYTYGPPLAVAPVPEVRKVLNYAVTVIPRRKILMGMPNYGYNWTLPYRQGTAARTVSNSGAVDLAFREGAAIQYDTAQQAPYFEYRDDQGRAHVVWFDDARSIQARLKLVDEYDLGGVSYWTINRWFPQNWLVLSAMYDVRKVL
ncbi:MAG: glycoside hydrolase family 18 protein [Eubacteriales bacterium]